MKERLKRGVVHISANPVLRRSFRTMKPSTGVWGVMGIVLFFIAPEIVAFGWGEQIAGWAHQRYLIEPVQIVRLNYRLVEMFFEGGGSWLNLGIGFTMLGWIAWERARNRAEDG